MSLLLLSPRQRPSPQARCQRHDEDWEEKEEEEEGEEEEEDDEQ